MSDPFANRESEAKTTWYQDRLLSELCARVSACTRACVSTSRSFQCNVVWRIVFPSCYRKNKRKESNERDEKTAFFTKREKERGFVWKQDDTDRERGTMSETTSVEQQQQQQQYVGGSSNLEHYCKDCDVYFESNKSLEVHLRYNHENLLSQWASQAQEESNNNNSKAGNHNSHVGVKRDSVTAPADSSETTSRPPSQDPTSSTQQPSQQQQQQQPSQQQQQAQQQQQQQQQPTAAQAYNQFQPSMFSEANYYMQNDQAYMMPHHYSPPREDNGGGSYSRYHPYQQHFAPDRTSSVSSTSPRSPPLQCDKCGAVYENANQLAEHVRVNHSNSPGGYPQHQYQQLGSSPQQQNQQQQQQMHASPPQSSQQQQQSYDYNGGQPVEIEAKQEPDEQAEILDLDSHKVQTHRYEEELMRLHQQQQQQQELQMQMHQQQVMQQHQQQQRAGTHSVSSMLGWPPAAQPHDYHPGLSPMGPIDSVSSLSDQGQFMRGQHMPVEPRHPSSSIITSTQPIPGHQMPGGLLQQPPKPPPLANQSWKSNEARRPKTYNCTACNKWFTSSGHLKRHYNTTLHKNAVKQSNQPDPANLPISAHHHPGRDSHSGGRGGGPSRSPELSSSGSPPNLMAGPSGEAARGLLHTPTTLYNSSSSNSNNNNNNNNSNNSSSSSSESSAVAAALTQPSPLAVHLASTMVPPLNSPVESPLAGHHQQQMGSLSPQLAHQHQQQQQPQQQQQQQQLHHLSMGSPSGQVPVHPMNSPMSPMHPPPVPHLNSPSSMGPSHPHHHMNSPSPITPGSVHPAMASPTAMGGTTMPHQPYPNALPPHVIPTTNTPELLESITIHLTTIGNKVALFSGQSQHQQQSQHHNQQQQQQHQQQQQQQQHHQQQQQQQQLQQQQQQQEQEQQQLQCLDVLPGFGTFSNHHQRPLPCFTQFNIAGFLIGQNQLEAVNVGGLSPEENISPHNRSFESSGSNYDPYRNSPPRYESLTNMNVNMQPNTDGMIIKQYEIQTHHNQHLLHPLQQSQENLEANNNLPQQMHVKDELSPNQGGRLSEKNPKSKRISVITKEHQVTSTNTGSHYISENGFHKCIECDKIFNKACYLTQHNKSFHSGDKPFKCNQCGKRFPLEYLHAEHLQKHAGDKPYKCEICPKQFNHKTDLRRHMCLHTGEKPYACDTCGKGFIRKDHMMKHLETHKKKNNNYNVHLRTWFETSWRTSIKDFCIVKKWKQQSRPILDRIHIRTVFYLWLSKGKIEYVRSNDAHFCVYIERDPATFLESISFVLNTIEETLGLKCTSYIYK